MTDYSRLPPHMQDTARLYVERGIPGGSFFTAVVSNDLKGAFGRADDINTAAMRDWCAWLYNDAPCGCQGSAEAVADWVKAGGIAGIERARQAVNDAA
jgi:hypothetical protein